MIIKISPDELAKNQALEPEWYKGQVVAFEAKSSADGKSTNYIPTVKIEKDGRQLDYYFNSKALGMMEAFAAVVNEVSVADIRKTGVEVDSEKAIGKKVKVHLIQEPYQGRINNKIDNWLPYDSDTQPAF